MEKMPRNVEIDYSKYAPDIPVEEREAYYGLPKHVQFCKECVMSNQKPNSCYEFEHTIKSIKKTMVIQEDGVCDACHACHNKANGQIDWALREKELRELCDQYDVLLIFDEVATGFGRTGNRFVADLVLPDILVLGKALTGGYIGHAVTVANQKVFDAFYSDDDRKALMHGPTFMGNPLACAVALKGIEIFEREDYMSKIHRITEISHREMDGFADPRIREVRIMGGCTCVDVYDPATLEGFQQFAYEHGVFSRPFLTCMYTMMPYIIQEDELVQIYDVMKKWFRR